jgi:uncharacterized protein
VKVYAESSAVLCWLLGEAHSDEVFDRLAVAERVITSKLTLVEVDRALHRAVALDQMTPQDATQRRTTMAQVCGGWDLMPVGDEVLQRARQPLPAEPIRALDAIHLASALLARTRLPGIVVVSLDHRLRGAAGSLGLEVFPP